MALPKIEIGDDGMRRLYLNLNWGWDYYIAFLVVLRIELGRLGGFVNGKTELPTTTTQLRTKGEKYFEVLLTGYGGDSIEVRYRRINLYVVGIRIPGGRWVQLGMGEEDYFDKKDGAFDKFPFNGDYGSLYEDKFRTTTQPGEIPEKEGIEITLASLDKVIEHLLCVLRKGDAFNKNSRSNSATARAVCTIVFMTSESCRFRIISLWMLHLIGLRREKKGEDFVKDMPFWMEEFLKCWKTLSNIWKIKDSQPERARRSLEETNLGFGNGHRLTLKDLDAVLGVVKGDEIKSDDDTRPKKSSKRGK